MVPFLPADTMPATILKKRTFGLPEEIFSVRNKYGITVCMLMDNHSDKKSEKTLKPTLFLCPYRLSTASPPPPTASQYG